MFCNCAQIQILVIEIAFQIMTNSRSEAFRSTDCREILLISGGMTVNKLENRVQTAFIDICIVVSQIQIISDPEKNAVDFIAGASSDFCNRIRLNHGKIFF